MNKLSIYILFLIIELFSLYIYFKYDKIIAKLVLLFTFFIIIKGFNRKFIIINSLIVLLTIILYYIYFNNQYTEEPFSNKLKAFKEKEKVELKQHFKNSKITKNSKEDFKSKSFDDYMDGFKNYKFTRKVKNSVDALNKIPYYMEKFRELWK